MNVAPQLSDDDLTRDDMDMLQQVLINVKGSFPDSPYRQSEFDDVVGIEPEA